MPDTNDDRRLPSSAAAEKWLNPATGLPKETVAWYPVELVPEAIRRARAGQPSWGDRPARERTTVIRRLRDLVVENAARIARTDHEETGKLELEAKGILLPLLDLCAYYAKVAESLARGRSVGSGLLLGRECQVEYRPAGVVAVISPWNLPFYLAMAQIVPALAAGNAVVHKPSEHATRVGALVGELCHGAGVPEDVLQVLPGGAEVGAAIVEAGVDVISFTGSSNAGSQVMRAAATHLTPVLLELGGKDAAIICDDAELERAINGVTWGAFVNAGQNCISTKRAIAAKEIYAPFVAGVAARASALTERRRDLSPLTLEAEMDRMDRQIRDAVGKGARIVAGGKRLPGPGFYFEPTVIADCSPDMSVVREETFGPLLAVLSSTSDTDALELANNSEFGLGASVFSRSVQRALELARRLRTGSVAINDVMSPATNPRLPFGGTKRSGIGRALSEEGYTQFCLTQSIVVARLGGKSDPHWFPYPRLAEILVDRALGVYHGSLVEKVRRVFG